VEYELCVIGEGVCDAAGVSAGFSSPRRAPSRLSRLNRYTQHALERTLYILERREVIRFSGAKRTVHRVGV
jgi:hypothetical protein